MTLGTMDGKTTSAAEHPSVTVITQVDLFVMILTCKFIRPTLDNLIKSNVVIVNRDTKYKQGLGPELIPVYRQSARR